MSNNAERTYIMIKPDGVQRNLVGEIIKRFEQRGYHLAALKMVQVGLMPLACSNMLGFFVIHLLSCIAKRETPSRTLPGSCW
jgi:hypothetical protein